LPFGAPRRAVQVEVRLQHFQHGLDVLHLLDQALGLRLVQGEIGGEMAMQPVERSDGMGRGVVHALEFGRGRPNFLLAFAA
jgi:hypothetical protein